jgi:hypothetical protein
MHEATESISSLDRRVWGRQPYRLEQGGRTSTERPVWTLAVVMLDVDTQDPVELARSEDQHPVEALRAGGADETLGVSVRLGPPDKESRSA